MRIDVRLVKQAALTDVPRPDERDVVSVGGERQPERADGFLADRLLPFRRKDKGARRRPDVFDAIYTKSAKLVDVAADDEAQVAGAELGLQAGKQPVARFDRDVSW